jgi:hypothetical protein
MVEEEEWHLDEAAAVCRLARPKLFYIHCPVIRRLVELVTGIRQLRFFTGIVTTFMITITITILSDVATGQGDGVWREARGVEEEKR